MMTPPALEVRRRRDHADPVDDRRRSAAVESGRWHRVTAGVYVLTAEWVALKPHERHHVLVREVARRMRKPAVLAGAAAAAIHGIDLLGSWPRLVDVRTERTTGGRTHGAIRRRALGFAGVAVQPWEGMHFVTTPAQTALDLARWQSFTGAVAAVDQALWARRLGGALTTMEEIRELEDFASQRRWDAHAQRVLEAATDLADNVRESEARLLMKSLGFPAPRLQERRVLRTGRLVYGDFYFPEHDHWCELDGRGKYVSSDGTDDVDAAQSVIDEKNRENEIRREVSGFTRFETADIHPRRLYDILTGDGVPSRLPRP
jgi:hypothetical protein